MEEIIVLNLTAGTTTDSTAVPATVGLNTNNNVSFTNNTVSILHQGVYEIVGEAVLTSTAEGDTGFALYVDGASATQYVFDATGTGDGNAIPIYWVVDVENTSSSSFVTLSLLPVNTPTIVSGVWTVKKIS